jgi:hypothetical protein
MLGEHEMRDIDDSDQVQIICTQVPAVWRCRVCRRGFESELQNNKISVGRPVTAPVSRWRTIRKGKAPLSAEIGVMYRAMTSAVKGPTRAIIHRAAASP